MKTGAIKVKSHLVPCEIIAFIVLIGFAKKYGSMKTLLFSSFWLAGSPALYASTALGWHVLMQSHSLAQIAVLCRSAIMLAFTGVATPSKKAFIFSSSTGLDRT
jgi:hypothetical protein